MRWHRHRFLENMAKRSRPVCLVTPATLAELQPLRLTLVQRCDSALWRQFLQRYHYLGCRVPVGAHLRCFGHSGAGQILACLLWTSPAWKMAARDRWIGRSPEQRARNLQYIVNNGRFLILPWVQVKGLASTLLARSARQLPHDWRRHYGYTPLLLESCVDATRFRGTCYRAANWICLGKTVGRGRMDHRHQALAKTNKLIFVFPLQPRVQHRLCAADPSRVSLATD